MLISRCLRPRQFRSWNGYSRLLHSKGKNGNNHQRFRRDKPPPSTQHKRSLFEELFPEEYAKDPVTRGEKDYDVPRLRLPEVEEFFEESEHPTSSTAQHGPNVTARAATNASRHEQLAVLVLRSASKSLVEDDFRRVAPKGKHIKDWIGPGGFLQVIPARDPLTLEQTGFYFVLFPNPSHARTYQARVHRLHRLSMSYTPTSVKSPLPLQPGSIVEGEDAHALLQNYTLCPPAQRLDLKLLSPFYSGKTKAVLQERGYRQLVEGDRKSGRSVLFWVDGQSLTATIIRNIVAADGRDRGLAWNMVVEKVEPPKANFDEDIEAENSDYEEGAEWDSVRHTPSRWLLSFADENEARAFIRAWHRKPFPGARGEGLKLVRAEFLW